MDKSKKTMFIFSVILGISAFLLIILFPKKSINIKSENNTIVDSEINALRDTLKERSKKIIDLKRENFNLKSKDKKDANSNNDRPEPDKKSSDKSTQSSDPKDEGTPTEKSE